MELAFLKRIDFFPPPPLPPSPPLEEMAEICVATKSRNLGDALVLTTLPGKLKAAFPTLRVTTYPRGFNPVAFLGNPALDGIARLPRAVYGDDVNLGSGQLIQLKERFFDLPVSPRPRPELHLLPEESAWAEAFVRDRLLPGNEGKPLVLLHPWGTTRKEVAPVEFWDELVRRHGGRFRFWQVGLEGHSAVVGCEYYLLLPPARRHARRLFAIAARAGGFVGLDSGPMHVARAFDLPSLVLLNHLDIPDPEAVIARRESAPYFLHGNWKYSVLYRENEHAAMDRSTTKPRSDAPIWKKLDDFFARLAKTHL